MNFRALKIAVILLVFVLPWALYWREIDQHAQTLAKLAILEENQGLDQTNAISCQRPQVLKSLAEPQEILSNLATNSSETTLENLDLKDKKAPEISPSLRWLSQQSLNNVKRFLVLDAEEEQKLNDLLLENNSNNFEPIFSELIEKVLGPEKAKVFKEKKLEADNLEREEQVNKELFYWSRKLKLNPDQEKIFRSVLLEAEKSNLDLSVEISRRMQELSAKHQDKNKKSEAELRSGFREMNALMQELNQKQQRFLTEQIKPTLTDQQYNRLLAEIAVKQGLGTEALF